jgi:hypothetical protein
MSTMRVGGRSPLFFTVISIGTKLEPKMGVKKPQFLSNLHGAFQVVKSYQVENAMLDFIRFFKLVKFW